MATQPPGGGAEPSTNEHAASTPPSPSPSDPADAFDAALFTAVEYVPTALTAGPFTLTLDVSAAASTDFDLTGQALWPAAQLLADFLAGGGPGTAAVASAPAIVELGAGVGFTGLAAAAAAAAAGAAPTIVLTDGEPAVVDKVLSKNVEAFSQAQQAGPCRPPPAVSTALLRWGDPGAADALVATHSPGGFPLIIGADVTYSLAALPALFASAARLARQAAGGGGRFLLGYVSRSAALDRGVLAAAAEAGWGTGTEVEGSRRRMPCGTMEGWVIDFRR